MVRVNLPREKSCLCRLSSEINGTIKLPHQADNKAKFNEKRSRYDYAVIKEDGCLCLS